MTATYSRVREARCLYGTPSNSNSSSIQPTPAPKITRPPEATSSEATTRAMSSGCRYGTIVTLVPSRTVFVTGTSRPRTTNASIHSIVVKTAYGSWPRARAAST